MRQSRLDPKRFGIKEDPTKERRWSRTDMIDHNKELRGYSLVKKDGQSGGEVKYKEMILMERPRKVADEEQREREIRARSQKQAAQDMLREDVEELSSKHGRNLHKYISDDEDKD